MGQLRGNVTALASRWVGGAHHRLGSVGVQGCRTDDDVAGEREVRAHLPYRRRGVARDGRIEQTLVLGGDIALLF